MQTVGIRELKNNLSRYLRQLKPGQVLSITDRGRVIAELRAPKPEGNHAILTGRYDTLVETGVIRPASERGDPLAGWQRGVVKLPPGTVTALLNEERGGS